MPYRLAAGLAAATVIAGCTVAENEMPTRDDGARIFADNCAACHGSDAAGGVLAGGAEAPDLTVLARDNGGSFPRARTLSAIDGYGKGRAQDAMPEFGAMLVDVETVPVDIDGTFTPTPRPMAAVLFYLESIQVE
jgi:mono/diheme cytochrome c family protein